MLQLLRTAETLWNSSRILFSRWDLSPSQFNVLNLLRDHTSGLSQTELSEALLTHRSNVTGLVDRLEERGLLERHTVPGDRRAYRVALTDAGRKLLQEILPVYYQAAEEVWSPMSAKRAKELVAELDAIKIQAEVIAQKYGQK
ncbi:MAG: MarR family transcriptional regulator [Verrucomicrobia bacterium]|jgi:DNA-binding MarR family transcriptional regulator|nr:MarR family transcriptional regulator [Verrucomicrobiota bacterium]